MSKTDSLYAQGQELAQQLFGTPQGDFSDIPPGADVDDFDKTLVTWLFGYLLKERSNLSIRVKILCIITMCTAANQHEMLNKWIPTAKNAGCTREEVREAIVTMVAYAGWPAAHAALKIFADRWPKK